MILRGGPNVEVSDFHVLEATAAPRLQLVQQRGDSAPSAETRELKSAQIRYSSKSSFFSLARAEETRQSIPSYLGLKGCASCQHFLSCFFITCQEKRKQCDASDLLSCREQMFADCTRYKIHLYSYIFQHIKFIFIEINCA